VVAMSYVMITKC